MSQVSDFFSLGQAWDVLFVFLSASPFILSKYVSAQTFFRRFGLSLLPYSHNWIITSYTLYQLILLASESSQIVDSFLIRPRFISHTVNLNFSLRSFPAGHRCHLQVDSASQCYFWIVPPCLGPLDCERHQERTSCLIHHCIPRTWYLLTRWTDTVLCHISRR